MVKQKGLIMYTRLLLCACGLRVTRCDLIGVDCSGLMKLQQSTGIPRVWRTPEYEGPLEYEDP